MPWPSPLPPLKLAGYSVRRSVRADVPAIAALLLEDPVTRAREAPDQLSSYYDAFDAVDADPAHLLVVLDQENIESAPSSTANCSYSWPGHTGLKAEAVVGTAQLTLIPGLTRGGALRLQVEGVHVASHLQSKGIGAALFEWIDTVGHASGAKLAQLTTDKRRMEAHRFYERLGWHASHDGMKKAL